jgi:hypothetical protein
MITCRVHDRLVGELIRVRGNDANFSQKFEEASKKLKEHIQFRSFSSRWISH